MLHLILISIFFLLPGTFSLPPLQPKGTRKGGAVGDCEYLSIMEKNYAKSEKKKVIFPYGHPGAPRGRRKEDLFPHLHPCKPCSHAGGVPGDVPGTGTTHLGDISSRYKELSGISRSP